MSPSFYAIELGCDAFALYCFYNAWKQGKRWLMTVLAATLFGVAIEFYFLISESSSQQGYSYGQFLIMIGWSNYKVPLWVGLGWGSIVYASMWTADRLKVPLIAKMFTAGLLAVNIDLSLDPIAELMGFWRWHGVPSANYYGVPFDNFLGWLMIVGTYTLSSLLLFDKVPTSWKGKEYWVPFVAIVFAGLLTASGQWVLDFLYGPERKQLLPFMVIIAVSVSVVVYYGHSCRRDLEPNRCILSLPVFYHLLLLAIIFFTGEIDRCASLAVIVPVDLFVAFTAFAWNSLDRLFPQKP